MTRAGTSYWRETTALGEHPPLAATAAAEVAVIGGGITGICTAWELSRRGRSVILLEADRLAGAVTGHTTAKLSAHHGLGYASLSARLGPEPARLYADSQVAAMARVEEIIRELAIDCDLESRPSYTWAESEDTLERLAPEAVAAADAGLEAELVTETGLPFPVLGAVRIDNQRQFHPLKFLTALVDDLVARGVAVHESTRVRHLKEGEPCLLTTESGHRVRADDVVVATHYPIFDRSLLAARLIPHRELVVAGPLTGADPEGMYITPDHGTRSVRTAPAADGGRLAIVTGEKHRPGTRSTGQGFRALEEWALRQLPIGEITHRWAAQDNDSSDSVPFVGRLHPFSKHAYVATGFGGWGMSNGVMAANLLAALIVGESPAWARLYDPRRLDPVHEAWPVAKGQVEVGTHFVLDRVKALLPSIPDIAPGSGAVVTMRGRPVAVHRDDDGNLHAVSATCTHLGCLVQFNDAERSWDCPCHGSRFAPDGSVCNGPATRPLKPVDLSPQDEGTQGGAAAR